MEAKLTPLFDLTAFENGTCSLVHQYLGGHIVKNGAFFRAWAPRARAVSVVGSFNGWDREANPMVPQEGGIWTCFVPGAAQCDMYKFVLKTADGSLLYKADPYGFHSECRPGTASKLYDLSGYQWGDDTWLKERRRRPPASSPLHIYEVHLGSWRRGKDGSFLNYRDIAGQLIAYVKELGFTHIELLPVTEHPLDDSWGYQCTGYFAATSRFGTPHDLMYLIDQCHQADLGVILDWVPAHFPKDAHGLYEFDGTACFEYADPLRKEHAAWGTRVFDYGKGQVRSFLTSSARFWTELFHADGLRVDAVASMLYLDYGRQPGAWRPNQKGGKENLEAISLLQQINETLLGRFPDLLMIAEESTAFPGVTKPAKDGGLGFTLKWNMGWMNDALRYCQQDPLFRQYHHQDITFSLTYAFSEQFLLPISHDEVVHMKGSLISKMPGIPLEQFASVRLFYAYMLAHPGKKLLFMGAELGQYGEWAFDRTLDWHLLSHPMHAPLHGFFKAMGRFYREQPALWELDFSPEGFAWLCADDNQGNTIAFLRRDQKGKALIMAFNFSPIHQKAYRLGAPEAGYYAQLLSTDDRAFGGYGHGNSGPLKTEPIPCHGYDQSLVIELPPLGGVFLRLKKRFSKAPFGADDGQGRSNPPPKEGSSTQVQQEKGKGADGP